jgi:hypothetical protein
MAGSTKGQVRHGSATTTHAVGAAIQRSQASLARLSRELGINPKTVAKWRKRAAVEDVQTGLKEPRSTVPTEEEKAAVVAFRRHTLLPLDDCLYALQPSIPHLTRSSLHRRLQRHGISRLPDIEGDLLPGSSSFKSRFCSGTGAFFDWMRNSRGVRPSLLVCGRYQMLSVHLAATKCWASVEPDENPVQPSSSPQAKAAKPLGSKSRTRL